MNQPGDLIDQLNEWKKGLDTISPAQAEYEKWLFVQAASTLFGGKAGELIVIREGQFEISIEGCLDITENLCMSCGINCIELHRNAISCKLMVYREDILNKRLAKVPLWILCRHLNYRPGVDANMFLNKLRWRWNLSGTIPHEIGIALGYPLKDVWGFMGISSQKCSGCCGWQIFGDPQPSIEQYQRYKTARQKALFFLHANN